MSRSSRARPAADPQSQPSEAAQAYSGPSKSQLKREMTARQQLGERLVSLSSAKLAQLPLADSLHDAIQQAQRIKSHEARRRQLQYIGKLMRDADAAAIEAQLAEWDTGSREHAAHFHSLERWRERLLDDDAELTAFVARYPEADVQHLRSLIRAARAEAQANNSLPNDREPQRKHYRALFQQIKNLLDTEAPQAPEAPSQGNA